MHSYVMHSYVMHSYVMHSYDMHSYDMHSYAVVEHLLNAHKLPLCPQPFYEVASSPFCAFSSPPEAGTRLARTWLAD